MPGYQSEMNFRLGASFDAVAWSQFAQWLLGAIGFAEDTRYELVMERRDGERESHDAAAGELPGYLPPSRWPDLHQIFLNNHWMKTMNVRLHLVRREDHAHLTIKLDLHDARQRQALEQQIREKLAAAQAEAFASPRSQERERLFGAMLLAESVVRETGGHFLAGEYRAALAAGWELLQTRIKTILPYRPGLEHRILDFLKQDPPPVLFPNLSGKELRQELDGLAHLLIGFLSVLQPLLQGREKLSENPASVLKFLVFLSLLVERLEATVPNPAAGKKPARSRAKPKPAGRKPRTATKRAKPVKKVVKKSAPKSRR